MTKHAKPTIHNRDHEHGGADPVRIHFEDVGTSGGGGDGLAIKYDTYPQSGGYIAADTNGGGIAFTNLDTGANSPVSLTQRDDGGIQLQDEGNGGVNIQSSHGGLIFIQQAGGGDILLGITAGGLIRIQTLPTSDPGVTGALWNNSGVLNIST